MKPITFCIIGWTALLSGCSVFNALGYYKYQAAERGTAAEAESVTYPPSFEGGVRMDGPMMRALQVAMNEFMPPGVRAKGDDERIIQCLSRWETFDTSVLRGGEDVFFVRFLPRFSRCGIEEIILDAGATYAIDGQGRILDVK